MRFIIFKSFREYSVYVWVKTYHTDTFSLSIIRSYKQNRDLLMKTVLCY